MFKIRWYVLIVHDLKNLDPPLLTSIYLIGLMPFMFFLFCSLLFSKMFQDGTIRSCDFSTEQTLVLHTIERRTDSINIDSDVHMALTPLEPSVFFGFPKRMSVTGSISDF